MRIDIYNTVQIKLIIKNIDHHLPCRIETNDLGILKQNDLPDQSNSLLSIIEDSLIDM